MNRDTLISSIRLFACFFHDADKGADFFLEGFIDKKFLGVLNSAEEKKRFAAYYAKEKEKVKTNLEFGAEESEIYRQVTSFVNQQHLLQNRFILVVYLLEACKVLDPKKAEKVAEIAEAFHVNTAAYQFLYDFAFSSDPYADHHESVMVLDGLQEKIGRYTHYYQPGFVGEVLILKLREFDFLLGRSFYPHPIFVNEKGYSNDEIFVFRNGENIRQGKNSVFFSDVAREFIDETVAQKYTLCADNLGLSFSKKIKVLRNINLCEDSGNLVGIMGASGAGKTTLLNVLTGIEKPTEGEVRINGISLHHNHKKFEGAIGYISQDDLLMEELTVYQNLLFNAQLIFKGYKKSALRKLVLKTLGSIGLSDIKDVKVGSPLNKKISGGQRKRLNIALELIREPSILFVDEPTSGLSSRDSEVVMELLKELSRKGKLIFVVIHQPSSDLYKLFDKIVILDTGGYQAYYGNPQEAPGYFKKTADYINSEQGACESCENINPEVIFNILEEKTIEQDGHYSATRKISAPAWGEFYRQQFPPDFSREIKEQPPKEFVLPAKIKQFLVFLKRDFLSKAGNTQYLLINLLEAPALAAILAFVVRYIAKFDQHHYIFRENENLPAFIFMSVIVMLFLGMSVSAEEIFRDQKILKREKFLHLSRFSYLTSKAALLFGLGAIQAALFVLIGNYIMGIKGMFIPYFFMLFSVCAAANLLGLIISSTFNSVVTIYIMIPLFIIPQMILGGAMFSYDKLNAAIGGGSKVPLVADLTVSRWAYEGLAVHQFMHNNFDKNFYEDDKKISELNYQMVHALPYLSQVAQDARALISTENDSLKEVLEAKLFLLQTEISKVLAKDPAKKFLYIKRMRRGLYSKYVANATVEFFDQLVKEYTQKFLDADNAKNNKISALLETAEDERKFQRIKDEFSNEYLADVVKRTHAKNKHKIENDELKQLADPIYMNPDSGSFSVDTHFYAPKKFLFGQLTETLWFNILLIWCFILVSFVLLYFDLIKKVFLLVQRFSKLRTLYK